MEGTIDSEPDLPWFVHNSTTRPFSTALAKDGPSGPASVNSRKVVLSTWAAGIEVQEAIQAGKVTATPAAAEMTSGPYDLPNGGPVNHVDVRCPVVRMATGRAIIRSARSALRSTQGTRAPGHQAASAAAGAVGVGRSGHHPGRPVPYAHAVRILITGAGRAIGAATAEELSRAGHAVVATARDTSLLDGLEVALRLPLDVTDDRSVERALVLAGELDAVVNNAALSGKGPLESFPLDRLHTMLDTNTVGPLRILQHLLPEWRARGHGVVVNVSSVQGRVATPLEGPYSVSKFGLEALSETLHHELGHFGIRVVVIEPGYIAPGMKARDQVPGDSAYQPLWDEWAGTDAKVTGPSGRPGPELVAAAIRSAIEDAATPFRVPVGDDALMVLGARSQLDDAEFEATMRSTLGLTW